MAKDDSYKAYCAQRAQASLLRHLQETQILPEGRAARGDRAFVNFSSNDYLGLSQHPALIARAQDYAVRYGVGAGASRLITGNSPPYASIEKRLARGKGYKAALVMNSGYQANLTVLAALSDPEVAGVPVTILADRLCHNSLLQGAVLGGARLIRFRHNNYDHLEENLRRESEKGDRLIIVSESVFGMDGDCADLAALSSLAKRYSAMLYIDEAHATGLFGMNGFGLAAGHAGDIDVAMGTFGKALGSFGAYITCSKVLRDYLVQRCGGLVYSTALPPMVLGAMEAALELLPSMERERIFVQQEAANVRDTLRDQGWNCGNSTTQIIPIILSDEDAALALAEILANNGILVPAIRPPTVPRGTSRLRLSISAAHRLEDIDRLIVVMSEQAGRFASVSAASTANLAS